MGWGFHERGSMNGGSVKGGSMNGCHEGTLPFWSTRERYASYWNAFLFVVAKERRLTNIPVYKN